MNGISFRNTRCETSFSRFVGIRDGEHCSPEVHFLFSTPDPPIHWLPKNEIVSVYLHSNQHSVTPVFLLYNKKRKHLLQTHLWNSSVSINRYNNGRVRRIDSSISNYDGIRKFSKPCSIRKILFFIFDNYIKKISNISEM